MHVTIINGIPDDTFAAHEQAIEAAVEQCKQNHTLDTFTVRDMDIHDCSGCLSCWVKTPGRCIYKDDMETVLRSLTKSELILFISPLSAGFISRQTKNVLDRCVSIVLPYTQIIQGECHHPKRYDNHADFGVILVDDGKLETEAADITYAVFDRIALNYHAGSVMKRTETPAEMEGVFHEMLDH